jgi:predicted N-acyltransferase
MFEASHSSSSPKTRYKLALVHSITEIKAEIWDDLANPDGRNSQTYNPFVSHAFLAALELSGSATRDTGWQPFHLTLQDLDHAHGLMAAMPAYLKSHSYGEYVFDHGWADAFMRAGGQYYPKLQISVPFTPATAPKLLTGHHPDKAFLDGQLVKAAQNLCRNFGLSSVHATFLIPHDRQVFDKGHYLQRQDQQFHWINRGYDCFEDFLQELTSRKRKQLKKEREKALKSRLKVQWLTGKDIQEHHWDVFYSFYQDTSARKWGQAYLTRQFFSLIGETLSEDIVLMLALDGERPIAGALNFKGGETLFGRQWGCIEHHPFLHFELCYYQAIDYAIAHGLQSIEAGAQGAHKLARGYEPVITHSAHWIAHQGLREAVEHYLIHERGLVAMDQDELKEQGPYRKG